MVIGRCHLRPCQRAEILAGGLSPEKKDWKNTIMAIRQMKQPARKERNPEPGSRKVPKPRWVEPYTLTSPTVNQKRALTRSAGN
jgi:hypothetical protein